MPKIVNIENHVVEERYMVFNNLAGNDGVVGTGRFGRRRWWWWSQLANHQREGWWNVDGCRVEVRGMVRSKAGKWVHIKMVKSNPWVSHLFAVTSHLEWMGEMRKRKKRASESKWEKIQWWSGVVIKFNGRNGPGQAPMSTDFLTYLVASHFVYINIGPAPIHLGPYRPTGARPVRPPLIWTQLSERIIDFLDIKIRELVQLGSTWGWSPC